MEGKDIPFHPFVLELYLASISFNGSTITWPDARAAGYRETILTAIQAICAGVLTKSGGSQPLTAALNLGATYGVTAASFTAAGTSALTTVSSTTVGATTGNITTVNATTVNATTVGATTANCETVNASFVYAPNAGPSLIQFAGLSIPTGGADKYIRPAGASGTVNTTQIPWIAPAAMQIRGASVSCPSLGGADLTLSIRVDTVEVASIFMESGNTTYFTDGFTGAAISAGSGITIHATWGGSATGEIHVTLMLGTA